jgi:putative DNA methylase
MYRKKLIEVALPLEAINKASAKEKSIRHGHPSTLHLWWARRPLAACRAVLFSSLVDDPSSHSDRFPTEAEQAKERERLFRIIEELVEWENVNNKTVVNKAKDEIQKYNGNRPPPVCDPFCGGGSIPLEAQRLGLETHASDLNPVAVLITKALVEIPAKFANQAPVNPESRKQLLANNAYPASLGLATDIRYYGEWMRKRASELIGSLYPPAKLSDGTEATIIAWLWARTVRCSNPACLAEMPLISSFQLAMKSGKRAWIDPEINHTTKRVTFRIKTGEGDVPAPPKTGRGAKFRCLVCNQVSPSEHIKTEGCAGRMGTRLIAIVAQGRKERIYLEPTAEQERLANSAHSSWSPDEELGYDPRNVWCVQYGFKLFRDLFTPRQLKALTTFSDLVIEARGQVVADGGSEEYANAIATYLAFAVDRSADFGCTICTWSPQPKNELVTHAFGRQAIPMTWDFGEVNPFSQSGGNFLGNVEYVAKGIQNLGGEAAEVRQLDARYIDGIDWMYSTDPPYYDNIGYADLSDFFYIWLRRALFPIYPQLFSTLLVPKAEELIATPYRFGGDREKAQEFFETGFALVMEKIRARQHPEYPFTLFYAFRQSEEGDQQGGDAPIVSSTGWETMLEGLLRADFQITGTWPMRTERPTGMKSSVNALASSVVLVCRHRSKTAPITSRKDFLSALRRELGPAVRTLQLGNIAPVDLQQAAIGPGMAIFSQYKRIIESDGTEMRVRTALGLINQSLDEVLSEQESDYDAETRWALAWFEQHQFDEGPFGDANTLANAKALSVEGLQRAGVLLARAGKVRLLKREELLPNWNPANHARFTVWEVTQQLIHRLASKGQEAANDLAVQVGGMAETARELAYRLYTLCERKGWAEEAGYYNALVVAWPAIRSQEFTLSGDK